MKRRITDEQIAFVRRNFANMRNCDLAEQAGVSESTVCRIQSWYHLRKSAKHNTLMGRKAGLASLEARGGAQICDLFTPEIIAKRVASFKETRRLECARVSFGLEQKTGLKVIRQPRPKRRQRCYLKQHGYIIDDKNLVAYWTDKTERCQIMEKGNRNRQYFKFKPLSERGEQ